MAGNFRVWWDENGTLTWSGRSELYVPIPGCDGQLFTKNHIISHGSAMRMLVNRINEAYDPNSTNRFSFEQNLNCILQAIGITPDDLTEPWRPSVPNAIDTLTSHVKQGLKSDAVCKAVETLEEIILNWPFNICCGYRVVNSEIGDCLDLPAHAIAYHILQNGETVYTSMNAMPQQNLGGCQVKFPATNSSIYQRLSSLLFHSDWKTGELQIQCGMLPIFNQSYFVVISSTNANCLTKDKLTRAPQTYYFGIPFQRVYRAPMEWFLFQQTSDFTYTAVR